MERNLSLIKITENEKGEPTVSCRELYEFLEVKTKYIDWINRRIKDYGFVENVDFIVLNELSQKKEGSRIVKREVQNHIVKLDIAKELAMVERNEKGKQIRQYFIEIEKKYNDPMYQMARSLQYANNIIEQNRVEISKLKLENTEQKEIIIEQKPKVEFADNVLSSEKVVTITVIAKQYGMSAIKFNKLLNKLGIQYKVNGVWVLYSKYQDKGYTKVITQIDRNGEPRELTKWTNKGRKFIYELLRDNDIVPVDEEI